MNGAGTPLSPSPSAHGRWGRPLDDLLVVDAHAHLGPTDALFIPHNDAEGMVATMDAVGIDRACVAPLASIGPDHRLGNDLLAAAVRAYPTRIVAFPAVNPNVPEEVWAELERCAAMMPVRGVKLHPGFHDYPAGGPHYAPALEFAQRRGLVVLSHSWDSADVLDRLSRAYPGARLLAAHTAGAWNGRRPEPLFEVARRRENVYLDLCSSLVYYGALEELVRLVPIEQVLYASDFPYMDAAYQIGRVLGSRLSDSQKERILGRNAAALGL